MGVAILYADRLNLPEMFAAKLRGKKVEVIDNGDTTITIKPINSAISEARGMLRESSFGTHTLLEQKRLEKEFEYGE